MARRGTRSRWAWPRRASTRSSGRRACPPSRRRRRREASLPPRRRRQPTTTRTRGGARCRAPTAPSASCSARATRASSRWSRCWGAACWTATRCCSSTTRSGRGSRRRTPRCSRLRFYPPSLAGGYTPPCGAYAPPPPSQVRRAARAAREARRLRPDRRRGRRACAPRLEPFPSPHHTVIALPPLSTHPRPGHSLTTSLCARGSCLAPGTTALLTDPRVGHVCLTGSEATATAVRATLDGAAALPGGYTPPCRCLCPLLSSQVRATLDGAAPPRRGVGLSAELGCATPVLVAGGAWTEAELRNAGVPRLPPAALRRSRASRAACRPQGRAQIGLLARQCLRRSRVPSRHGPTPPTRPLPHPAQP